MQYKNDESMHDKKPPKFDDDESKKNVSLSNVNTKIATLEQNVVGITFLLNEINDSLKGTANKPGYRTRIEFLERDLKIACLELENIKIRLEKGDMANGPLAARLISLISRVEEKLDHEKRDVGKLNDKIEKDLGTFQPDGFEKIN